MNSAIVTGGSYEEGLSIAEALCRCGYGVSIWDEELGPLESARDELHGLGYEVDIRCLDIGNVSQLTATYQAVKDLQGVPAALFNMATLKNSYLHGDPETRTDELVPFWNVDRDKLKRVMEVNAIGTMLCSATVAVDMVAAKTGSIVNFSTGSHTQRDVGHVPYGPSKSFVESFSTAISFQLEPHGVRVNVISAGGMVNRRGKSDPKHVPSDWADELVAYLAGDDSKAVTAQLYQGASLVPIKSLRDL